MRREIGRLQRGRARLRSGAARTLCLLGLWASTGCLAPQAVGVAEPSSAVSPPESHSLFAWELQVERSTLTLIGSVHVASEDLYPLDERLEAQFERSDVLVLELDNSDPQRAASLLRGHGSVSPGESLADQLSDKTLLRLSEVLKEQGASLRAYSKYRAWFVATVLTMQALRSAGFDASHGIDEHFRSRAREAGKPIVGLETLEQQLSLLSGLNDKTQESLLLSTLDNLHLQGEQLVEALEWWQHGDAEALDRELLEPLRKDHAQLFAEVFAVRNHQMVQRLLELAKKPGRYLVVVGAGHLVGRSGIVDLFAKRGIVARQL